MKAIVEKIRSWADRERDASYFGAPGTEADLAISREDGLRLVGSREDVRARLTEMASRFGLTAADIDADRQTALDVAITCGECRSEKTCQHYLAGDSNADPRDFCPNAGTYAGLRN